MTIIEAILVAIVEGLTEFLPISSTGHMIITQSLLNIESSAFVKAYTIIIQFGAILSVVVLYWERFFKLNQVETVKRNEAEKLTRREKSELIWRNFTYKFDFYLKLLVALMPAIILGVILGDVIDNMLESVTVVAIMLIIGGVFMLFVDRWFNHPKKDQSIDWIRALKIGFFQCIAMIPGVSRSMATIVGGMGIGLNRKNAAEFSFFLAVPTMAAAAGYKIFQLIKIQLNLKCYLRIFYCWL